MPTSNDENLAWKSKVFWEESIKLLDTFYDSLASSTCIEGRKTNEQKKKNLGSKFFVFVRLKP